MSELDLEKFKRECLEEHNKLRALHNAPPLKLSAKLSKFAEEWAKNLLRRNKMEHRTDNKYGENIYMGMGVNFSGTAPVSQWYAEIKDYDYNKAAFSPNTGHFTQVIWKDTTELGVGVAAKGKTIYVVCNYNPPGNIVNRLKDNVLPLKKTELMSSIPLAVVRYNPPPQPKLPPVPLPWKESDITAEK